MTHPPPERSISRPGSPESRVATLERALSVAEARLRTIAGTDPLTELLNRRGLQEALSTAVRGTGRRGLFAVLVDLDDFRSVNDALGHVAGDVVLREVGRLLSRSVPDASPLGRIGGDEFLLLLSGIDESEGLRIAEALRLCISDTTIALAAGPRRVTASVALAAVDDETPSIDEVLSSAYLALQGSKRNGKNRVSAVPGRESPGVVARIVSDVRRGRGLRSVMQPIMSLPDVTPVAYELLTRSTVEVFEMPTDLFRLAHEANILTLVDHRCWKTCLASSVALPSHVRVNVNLFPSTLLAVPTEDLLRAFPAGRALSGYCVEISEQQIIGDPAYLLDAVQALRAHGVHIAIDDVGFGRTCLESLVLLEPDVVKIDRRCVTGARQDARQRRGLERLLGVARSLEAEVVAEGVETEDDLEVMIDVGVGLAQGFLWGRPRPVPVTDGL